MQKRQFIREKSKLCLIIYYVLPDVVSLVFFFILFPHLITQCICRLPHSGEYSVVSCVLLNISKYREDGPVLQYISLFQATWTILFQVLLQFISECKGEKNS